MEENMKDMMDTIEKNMVQIYQGDIVKGEIISVNKDEVMVNIGYSSDGIVKKEELVYDMELDLTEEFKEGDEIKVYVVKKNDGEGNLILSKKEADKDIVWDEFKTSLDDRKTINVKISEVVKGGVVAKYKDVRTFIPASQLSINYVENLKEYVGKTLDVIVIDLDKEKKKVVLSRKEIEKEIAAKNRKKVLATLQKGEKREGVVKRTTHFGAFVDIGGIDGLIHISDLSWKKVSHVEDVVSVGDKVSVYVLDFDKAKGKISLGLKQIEDNPWNNIKQLKVDSIVEGKVVKTLDFGAFVEIKDGVEGLVHISQISEDRVSKVADVLNVGDKVKVKILDINEKDNKISLSIKEAIGKSNEAYEEYIDEEESSSTIGDLFKDKLGKLKF